MDLNADMAEDDRWTGRDRALLDVVTSASIACGFHAGNRSVMRAAAAACVERGVAIGAHFSYRDRIGFGRRDREVTTDRLAGDVLEQWTTLLDESAAVGGTVAYAKPHGALYHRMATDPEIAAAVVDGRVAPACTMLVAPPGTRCRRRGRSRRAPGRGRGLPRPRLRRRRRARPATSPAPWSTTKTAGRRPGAPALVGGGIATSGGRWIELRVETLCIHGDSPGAGARARAVRERWSADITLRPDCRSGLPFSVLDGRRMTVTAAGAAIAFGDGALLVETSDVDQAAAHDAMRWPGGPHGRARRRAASRKSWSGSPTCVIVLDLDRSTRPTQIGAPPGWHLCRRAPRREARRAAVDPPRPHQSHVLPVVFDGADLDEVAAAHRHLDRPWSIRAGSAADLRVAFLGFAPGFPYLTGLPPELAALPRRDAPRTSVPAGSVAVGGGFASIYPRASPGGWQLLGWTDVPLFDPDAPPYALVRPGDRVRFTVAGTGALPPCAGTGTVHPRPRRSWRRP